MGGGGKYAVGTNALFLPLMLFVILVTSGKMYQGQDFLSGGSPPMEFPPP